MEVETAPVTVVEPVYPEVAKKAHVQGLVVMAVVIARNGRVESAEAIAGHPLLVGAALNAVSQWVWKPFLLNGKAVRIRTKVTCNFVLDSSVK